MNLQDRINTSVADALAQLAKDAAWRCYTGPKQSQLLDQLCEVTGASHAGLASSGTAGLEMLLRAMELQSDDEVMLSGYDYPGNFAAIERVGAWPVLVDIESGGWGLGLEQLEAAYSPRCKVLIASHLHGQLQAIGALEAWCHEHGMRLIQDACQALGASIDGQPLAAWGDATLLSFGGTKVISAGRGGAWATRDERLALIARRAAGVGSGTYEMSELQASVVLAQLPYLDEITKRCREFFISQCEYMEQHIPGATAPWWPARQATAFYQAGWILPQDVDPQAVHADVQGLAAPLAVGFAGFHRRSARRARIGQPLIHVTQVAARTVTMHHRSALLWKITIR